MTPSHLDLLINDTELADTARQALLGADVQTVTASPLRPVHNGFHAFIEQESFDISEIAIVTLLQAIAHDKPVLFLPLTALGRHQHQTLISTADLTVGDLPGRTVGIRAWSQTTGLWVRGFLADQYGVDLRAVNWRTYEGGHVTEQADPAWITRAGEGDSLAADLLSGRVDYAVMGNDRPHNDAVHSVIANPAERGKRWSRSTGYVPVNHVFAVSATAAHDAPDAVCQMYDAVAACLRSRNGQGDGPPLSPYGFEALRPAVTAAAKYAWDQELLPRRLNYDELVKTTCTALGVTPQRLGG